MIITALQVGDMFDQIRRMGLGQTDVAVHCGHCATTYSSPAQFAVHLLTCECSNPTHNHAAS